MRFVINQRTRCPECGQDPIGVVARWHGALRLEPVYDDPNAEYGSVYVTTDPVVWGQTQTVIRNRTQDSIKLMCHECRHEWWTQFTVDHPEAMLGSTVHGAGDVNFPAWPIMIRIPSDDIIYEVTAHCFSQEMAQRHDNFFRAVCTALTLWRDTTESGQEARDHTGGNFTVCQLGDYCQDPELVEILLNAGISHLRVSVFSQTTLWSWTNSTQLMERESPVNTHNWRISQVDNGIRGLQVSMRAAMENYISPVQVTATVTRTEPIMQMVTEILHNAEDAVNAQQLQAGLTRMAPAAVELTADAADEEDLDG